MQIRILELQYEDYTNNSHKFYRVYIGGSHALLQWGRIGSTGQFKTESTSTARTRVTQKENAGYNAIAPWTDTTVNDQTWITAIGQNGQNGGDVAGARRSIASSGNLAVNQTMSASQARKIIDQAPSHYPTPSKTEAEAERALKEQLLSMARRYKAPDEPDTDQPDPDSVEGRLGAALAMAKGKK